jgi:dihydrofolate reductase
MSKVCSDISMSLDGFITGPNDSVELPLGEGGDVSVAGGANIIQQSIKARLLDEFQIHLVPVLLGDGRRLFDRMGAERIELESTRVIESPGVTHLRFRFAS